MMRSLYTAASGMIAEQANVDTISHNLSNVNTTGYKAERTEFKSLLYQTLQTRTTTANGELKPVGAQVGLGTRVAAVTSIFTQGPMLASEVATDFAIEGSGFFAVRDIDGTTAYTRNGAFSWSIAADNSTILTTKDGRPIMDREGNNIQVPAPNSVIRITNASTAESLRTQDPDNVVAVNADGSIDYRMPEETTSESMEFFEDGSIAYRLPGGNVVELNQFFAVYQFNNPAGLEKVSASRLKETAASGNPMLEGVTQGLRPSNVVHKYLEGSGVQVADEMVNLIVAQRAYELNSKAITTSDSMLETANNLKR